MRGQLWAIVALLVIIAVLLGAQFFHASTERWSYAVIAPKDEELMETLNRLGSLGWEIVSSRRATSKDGGDVKGIYEMILKRHASSLEQSPAAAK